MQLNLENDHLCVTVETFGAEVLSVRDKAGTEYMWQREPSVWQRTAPVLFPVIGRLRGEGYTLDGEHYALPRHGFARDLPFAVTARSDTSVTLTLTADAHTRACYPFGFVLDICYELDGPRLHKTHTVYNQSLQPLLFELGGHDGFRVALDPGETMGDYYLLFEGQDQLHHRIIGADGLLGAAHSVMPLDEGRLWLDMALFRQDAIVLDTPKLRRVLLCNARGNRRLIFDYPDFSVLGIWTPHMPFDTNFVCLEAWTSLPDSVTAGEELASKERVCTLPPNRHAKFCYATTFPLPGTAAGG